MNLKHFSMALMLCTVIISSTAFAAEATANTATEQTTQTLHQNGKPCRGDKDRPGKHQHGAYPDKGGFIREFKEDEAKLLDTLDNQDKAEAAQSLKDFYIKAFKEMPKRNCELLDSLANSIDSLTLPAAAKEQVIAKIKNYNTERYQSIQDGAITFAQSLLDLPAHKRNVALTEYNEYLAHYVFSGGKGRHHNGGMNRGGRDNMHREQAGTPRHMQGSPHGSRPEMNNDGMHNRPGMGMMPQGMMQGMYSQPGILIPVFIQQQPNPMPGYMYGNMNQWVPTPQFMGNGSICQTPPRPERPEFMGRRPGFRGGYQDRPEDNGFSQCPDCPRPNRDTEVQDQDIAE